MLAVGETFAGAIAQNMICLSTDSEHRVWAPVVHILRESARCRLCYLLWLTSKSHTASFLLHSIPWHRRARSGKAHEEDGVEVSIFLWYFFENLTCYKDTFRDGNATCLHFYVLLSSPKGLLSLCAITLCIMDLIFSNKYKRCVYYCTVQGEMQRWERLNSSLKRVYLCLTSCIRGRAFKQGVPSNNDIIIREIIFCLHFSTLTCSYFT